jgi:hypothetical protein
MTRTPWVAGAVLLLLLALLVAPLAVRFGLRYWAFYAGAAALLLLLAGWLERLWQSRPLARPWPRGRGRSRWRVVRGGRGDGRADGPDSEGADEPRWLM